MNLKDLSSFVKSRLNKERLKPKSRDVASLFKNVSLNDQDFSSLKTPDASKEKQELYISPGQNSQNAQYYTYQGDNRYLDEKGREQNHLYIAPGEPLTPKNSAKEQIERDRGNFELPSDLQDVKTSKDALGRTVITGQSAVPPAPDLNPTSLGDERKTVSDDLNKNSAAINPDGFNRTQLPDVDAKAPSGDFAAGDSLQASSDNSERKSAPKNYSLPPAIKLLLFLRQLCASFFTYTNLNLIFTRTARSAGPAYPSSMPLTYFVVGVVSGLAAGLISSLVPEVLSGILLLGILIMFIGIGGLRGIGNFISVFSQRRLDTYSKAAIAFLVLAVLSGTFEGFRVWLNTDHRFDLVFASALMLSALTATSLNFKENPDPEDSYGVLSLTGLCVCSVIVLTVTFLLVNVFLALSMLGIVIFVRVVAGQFMYINKINAGRDNICGVQYLAMLLLMLDMLIVGRNTGIEGPVLTLLFN